VTPKRKYWLIGLSLVALVVAVVIVLLIALPVGETEPTYQGKPLSAWIVVRYPPQDVSLEGRKAAVIAIRAIGTNACPYLVKWIKQAREPSWMAEHLKNLVNQLPKAITPRSAQTWTDKPDNSHSLDAVGAFEFLGEAGRPAIPELKKILYDRGASSVVCSLAAQALQAIGPAATPALLEILTDTNAPNRADAALALSGYVLPNDEVFSMVPRINDNSTVVPVLVSTLSDKDRHVAYNVVFALGIRAQYTQPMPELVLPALTNLLQQETLNYFDRANTMRTIGYYGSKARMALPALLPYTTNSAHAVRDKAIEAIRKIAPETLTNAPAL
jgi:hypothetical protein